MKRKTGAPSRALCGGVVAAVVAASFSMFTVAAQAKEGFDQQIIVKYKQNALSSKAQESAIGKALQQIGNRHGMILNRMRTMGTGAEVIKVNRDLDDKELASLFADFKSDPRVEYAEEDRIMHTLLTPNDTQFNSQWDMFEAAAGINAPAAWDTTTGTGAVIASIDTGVRYHADLTANLVGGYDFISSTTNNDGNGRDSDPSDPGDYNSAGQCGAGSAASNSSWHGTHVAGTAAGRGNNGLGIAGVAYTARVVPVRVLGRCGGTTADIADAIIWASGGTVSGVPANANPAKVLSLSLGGSGACDSTTQAAINSARSRNATVVVAAGNSNANAANFNPASCTGIITVASVGRTGARAYYSNFGAVVDVAAPGGDQSTGTANGILSTLNSGATTPGSDTYGYYQGTSQATPHVAGVAALLYALRPASTTDQIISAITSSARAFPATCSQCGSGIVNAAAAITAITGGTTPPPTGSCPAGYTSYTGTLSSVNASLYAPNTTGFTVSAGAALGGILTGPAGTDFDLYLQRRTSSGTTWTSVASSTSASSSETISTTGTTGYNYRWRIYSYAGTGTFSFCGRPQ